MRSRTVFLGDMTNSEFKWLDLSECISHQNRMMRD